MKKTVVWILIMLQLFAVAQAETVANIAILTVKEENGYSFRLPFSWLDHGEGNELLGNLSAANTSETIYVSAIDLYSDTLSAATMIIAAESATELTTDDLPRVEALLHEQAAPTGSQVTEAGFCTYGSTRYYRILLTDANDISMELFYCVKGGMLYSIGMSSVDSDDAAVILESFASIHEDSTTANVEYEAWQAEAYSLEVNVGGEIVRLNPTIALSVGVDGTRSYAWVELAVCIESEQAITIQAYYQNGILHYSVVGANDYVVMDNADYMIYLYSQIGVFEGGEGIFVGDVLTTLSELYKSPEALKGAISALSSEALQIESQPDGAYSFSLSIDGASVNGLLSLKKINNADRPFSFDEKTAVTFTARNGFWGGVDFTDAMQKGEILLMEDPSIASLLLLLEEVENIQRYSNP